MRMRRALPSCPFPAAPRPAPLCRPRPFRPRGASPGPAPAPAKMALRAVRALGANWAPLPALPALRRPRATPPSLRARSLGTSALLLAGEWKEPGALAGRVAALYTPVPCSLPATSGVQARLGVCILAMLHWPDSG